MPPNDGGWLPGFDPPPAVPKTLPPPPPDYDSMWTEFYERYPRHTHAHDGRKAFEKILRAGDAGLVELIRGADAYAQQCQRDRTEARWIAHPATWLNGRRWRDKYTDNRAAISASTASFARVGAALRAAADRV